MQSQYQSPNSVAKRQTVYIDVNDPRLSNGKWAATMARQGAEIVVVDISGTANLKISSVVGMAQASGGTQNPSPDSGAPNTTYYQAAKVLKAADTVTPPDPIVWDTVHTVWNGSTLHLAWTWDPAAPNNAYAQFVVLTFSNGSLTKTISVPSSQNSYDWTLTENRLMFGLPATSGLTITAVVQDAFGNDSTQPVVALTVPAYVSDILAPTSLNVVSVKNGYSVGYTTPTAADFTEISIEEVEVATDTSPDPGTGYVPVYTGIINPAVVITPNTNTRWVRARFTDSTGYFTGYSPSYRTKPTSPVAVNNQPPSEVTIGRTDVSPAETTAFWVGNNIYIPYTLPASNQGVRFVITLTAPNGSNGVFYAFSDGTTNLGQTAVITDAQLNSQFGQYYSSFTGIFQSASSQDARTSGVSFSVPTRGNPLSTIKPNPTISNIVDGYSVSVSNETAQVQHVEVYEYYTDPTTMLMMMGTLMDFMDAQYVSSGTTGKAGGSSIVMNNWTDQNAMMVVNPEYCYGMAIYGNGIDTNTYVTSITVGPGSGNYTVNLSKPLLTDASGSYNMPALVASGQSPLIRYSTYYSQVYVVVVYYDEFNNNSLFSDVKTAQALNPTTTFLSSPVLLSQASGNNGAVYLSSANSPTSGSRVLMGVNSSEAGIFVWGPNDSSPSTQIIGDQNIPYTFSTTNAHIGDWSITSNHIQNDLSSGSFALGYTGLSGSNSNYSFWAGANASDNSDGSAKFSVTPSGSVIARNLQIAGGSLDIGSSSYTYTGTGTTSSATLTVSSTANLVAGMYVVGNGIVIGTTIVSVGTESIVLSNKPTSNITNGAITFISTSGAHITNTGSLYATSANISGTITATGGSFSGNVQLASGITGGASIYSGTLNSSGSLTSQGFILNSSGITFANGSTNITTIDSSTGTFTTALANIGGWNINSSTIYKTAGSGTITLDSTNSLFTTKNSAGTYYSALSVPFAGNDSKTYVMWAGASANTAAGVAGANFRVGVDGTLYATGAVFNGTALSSSLSGLSTSVSNAATAASNAQTTATNAYNGLSNKITLGGAAADITSNNTTITGGNISTGTIKSTTYTAPATGSIYSQSGMSIVLDSTGSIISPNFVLDSSGNAYMKGNLSASVITGSAFYIDGYNYWNYANSTYGGSNFNVGNGGTDGYTFIHYDGSGTIKLQTPATNGGFYVGSDGAQHAQSSQAKISLDSTGLHINGLQVYGNDYRVSDYYGTGSYFNNNLNVVTSAPFTRSIIYSPMSASLGTTYDSGDGSNVVAGDLATGFAIYYGKTSTGTPNGGTGLIGDIFIEV